MTGTSLPDTHPEPPLRDVKRPWKPVWTRETGSAYTLAALATHSLVLRGIALRSEISSSPASSTPPYSIAHRR